MIGSRKHSKRPGPATAVRTGAARCGVRSFILVEILVAVVILGIALAAVLRSYTNGLRAVNADRRLTRGIFLAQGLLEDFEIEEPETESLEGDFAPDFPNYHFTATFEDVDIEYHNIDLGLGKVEFFPLRKVTIEVFYEPPTAREAERIIKIESYLTGIEKYAERTKFLNALY